MPVTVLSTDNYFNDISALINKYGSFDNLRDNGYAHVRASIVGNSTHIPLIDGVLHMGQWQQVVLIDFDNKARARQVNVQIMY